MLPTRTSIEIVTQNIGSTVEVMEGTKTMKCYGRSHLALQLQNGSGVHYGN